MEHYWLLVHCFDVIGYGQKMCILISVFSLYAVVL